MTLRHMKIFTAVCELESVTKAAEKLYISQPSVSQAIIDLERCYGVPLFDRIARRLYITDAGRQLYEYMTHILSLYDEMEDSMKHWGERGTIRIGSSITIGNRIVPELTARYQKLHPEVQVYVTIENSDHIEQRVLSGELDFALIEGTVHSGRIVSEPFMDDRLTLICAKNHPFSDAAHVSIEKLQKCPFLAREKGSGTRELVDSSLLAHNVCIEPVWESISTQALISGVQNGLGVSILPYRLAEPAVQAGTVVSVDLDELSFERPFSIIYSENKYLTAAAKELMEAVRAFGGGNRERSEDE